MSNQSIYPFSRFRGLDYPSVRRNTIDDELLFNLSYCNFENNPFIPLDEFLQFSIIRGRLAKYQEAGLDIVVMTNEQVIACGLAMKQRGRLFVSRSEYDYEVSDAWVSRITQNLNDKFVWWATNATSKDLRVKSLPYGLHDCHSWGDPHDVAGDIRLIAAFRAKQTQKLHTITACFNVGNYPAERLPAHEVLSKRDDVTWIEPGGIIQSNIQQLCLYYEVLAKSRFVANPRGNGIDCNRFYEALYCGAIPIMLKQNVLKCHEDLPILILDTWSDLKDIDLRNEEDRIRSSHWNLGKLTSSYYVREIDLSYDSIF